MSKEHDIYEFTCKTCRVVGLIDEWSDDWNRFGSDLYGFKTGLGQIPNNFHIGSLNAVCLKCGGMDIERGELLKADLPVFKDSSEKARKEARLYEIHTALEQNLRAKRNCS